MNEPKKVDASLLGKGPLTDVEVQKRMTQLIEIFDAAATNEVRLIEIKTTESFEELPRELVTEPKDAMDEWIEKLRAYTERQTAVHCARLRRVSKLNILESLSNLRDVVRQGVQDEIREIMSEKDGKGSEILREMLLQGVFRLMEPLVLVHATKTDFPKVKRHYAWVCMMYEKVTKMKLQLITSKHLKRRYIGRIVLSDNDYSIFVDVNLFTSVDQVVDRVFTQYAVDSGKFTSSISFTMVDLKEVGLRIMPRGPHITHSKLEALLSSMHGDPRTQEPNIQLHEDQYKQATRDVTEHDKRPKKKPLPEVPPVKQAVSRTESAVPLSVKNTMFVESEAVLTRHPKDLYNLENASSSELAANTEIILVPSQLNYEVRLPRNTVSPKVVQKQYNLTDGEEEHDDKQSNEFEPNKPENQ